MTRNEMLKALRKSDSILTFGLVLLVRKNFAFVRVIAAIDWDRANLAITAKKDLELRLMLGCLCKEVLKNTTVWTESSVEYSYFHDGLRPYLFCELKIRHYDNMSDLLVAYKNRKALVWSKNKRLSCDSSHLSLALGDEP